MVLIGVVEGFAEELLSVVYTIAQTRGHDQTDKHRLLVFRIQDKPFFPGVEKTSLCSPGLFLI